MPNLSRVLLAAALAAGALSATAAPARAGAPVVAPPSVPLFTDSTGAVYTTAKVVVPLVFPVVGPTSFTDTFLACRSGCTRRHMGQDLMGPKMSPEVAACDGVIGSVKRETKVGGGNYLTLVCDRGAAAGWSVVYVHVNNDTPGTDDGKGTKDFSFPTGIVPGARVLAGQLVAWRGDSGDAESTGPHLHVELHKGQGWGGVVYNAYPSLLAARRLSVPVGSGPHPDGTLVTTPTGTSYVVGAGTKRPGSPAVLAADGWSAASAVHISGAESLQYVTGPALTTADGIRDRLVRTDAGVFALGSDGLLHQGNTYTLASWGWQPSDAVAPVGDLPAVGAPLPLRDGTLANVGGVGTAVLSGGVVRRVWDARELAAYGYAGKPRLNVAASLVRGWRVGDLTAP